MDKLSTKKRLNIVTQYLSGLHYDEVADKSGVSKGTVANVVADLRAGRFPEAANGAEHIDLLLELSRDGPQTVKPEPWSVRHRANRSHPDGPMWP